MYKIRKATTEDIEMVLEMRYTTLRDVCSLKEDYSFDESFKSISRAYFANEDQTTVLVFDGEAPIGCATICYQFLMPTFDHPTGKRAHVMNVYVDENFRRQGIARKMMDVLIAEAKERDVTEISLDATEKGRLLYEAMCFKASKECMYLI